MKRLKQRLSALAVVGALLGTGLVAGIAVPASAAETAVCTPSGAWTETVNHPAVGEPTLTVKNPEYIPGTPEVPAVPAVGEPTIVVENEDYEPAVEEVSHIVNHPAVTKIVHHEAETKIVHHEAEVKEHAAITHTEYHFRKFTRTENKKNEGGGWGPWTPWSPEQHTSWELNTNPIGTPQHHGWEGYRERQWQAMYDGQSRTVVDKAAWTEVIKPAYDETVVVKEAYDETVIVTPAWDEKIIDVPAKPAVGEPTKTIDNPDYKLGTPGKPAVPAVGTPTIVIENTDYVEARSEVIEHAAVTCPVKAPGKTAETDDTLAATGGELPIVITVGAVLALVIGGAVVLLSRRKKIDEVVESVDAE